MDDKYAWQDNVFGAWRDNGFKGVVFATPASGKTIGGLKTVKTYLKYFEYDRIWIIANSKEVIAQWKEEAKRMELFDYLEFYTYPSAVSKMHKLDREAKLEQLPDLMILDECHFVNAPVWGQVMDFGVSKYLGLSGTPNGSERKLGGIIVKVDWDDANIADSDVYFVKYSPTEKELRQYEKRTTTIGKYREARPYSNYKNDQRLAMMYNARRALVWNFQSRLPIALDLIKKNEGKKIMVFCQHHKQAFAVGRLLEENNISHCVHVTGHEELERFLSGEVDICISCKKLSTGFNFPEADTAIIVSTATSPLTATQTLARVIRPDPNNPDKHATIYMILADNTNDMDITHSDIFIKSKMHTVKYDEIQ